MPSYDYCDALRVEVSPSGVLIATLNRPKKLCAPEEFLPRTRELAELLAAGPTRHYALTKQAVLRGLTREPKNAALFEAWGQDRALASEDFREGVQAVLERRSPSFKGR